MPAAATATAAAIAAPRWSRGLPRLTSTTSRPSASRPATAATAIGAGDSKPTSSRAGSWTARSSTGASVIQPARWSAAWAAASGTSARPTAPAAATAPHAARLRAWPPQQDHGLARERERGEVVGEQRERGDAGPRREPPRRRVVSARAKHQSAAAESSTSSE